MSNTAHGACPPGHVISRIEICGVCRRDPMFAAIGITCSKCVRTYMPGDKQPPLKRVGDGKGEKLVYEVESA